MSNKKSSELTSVRTSATNNNININTNSSNTTNGSNSNTSSAFYNNFFKTAKLSHEEKEKLMSENGEYEEEVTANLEQSIRASIPYRVWLVYLLCVIDIILFVVEIVK